MNDPRDVLLAAGYEGVLQRVLFSLGGGDAEVAHERTLGAVKVLNDVPALRAPVAALHAGPRAVVSLAGITFPGRVGLAAGLDKFAVGPRAWGSLGFSHVELGTVTAKGQPGNPKPRLFRARSSEGILNRMGFNNPGADAMAESLERNGVRRGNGVAGIPLGISLGKSKVTPLEDAVDDYRYSFDRLSPYADYVAVNVSSPNTPGLRKLQDADALGEIVRALVAAADEQAKATRTSPVPLFVKIAPDLTFDAIDDVLSVCAESGVRGLIATNTTLSRDGLVGADQVLADEAGGLSGAPLTRRALEVVTHVCRSTDLPVIGVGGIMTATDAERMFDAGARLVQVYSGYIYRGPALVRDINALPLRAELDA
ncbi:quinone-dependent dihydroorotate dehydrogenase [Mariniluteicoccus endophyticus]